MTPSAAAGWHKAGIDDQRLFELQPHGLLRARLAAVIEDQDACRVRGVDLASTLQPLAQRVSRGASRTHHRWLEYVGAMANLREQGWALFDAIVAEAELRNINPWFESEGKLAYDPDYDTLELLLGVPVFLSATSQSGVPALALDVWVAYEFRRAGFDPNRVWPRATAPRVLPSEIVSFIEKLPKKDRAALWSRVEGGIGGKGTANLLGKNYVKQVDVVMSAWATGPELMVSTKRMDSSFGKNAANRVEESYGDAKNLRLRHPQAALGFFYALSAIALETDAETAAWLTDLLIKLGREDDAYDAVALVLPDLTKAEEPTDPEPEDDAGPIDAGAADEPEDASQTLPAAGALDLGNVIPVRLYREGVPAELDPARFFKIMCERIFDNSPINFHSEARAMRRAALAAPVIWSGT